MSTAGAPEKIAQPISEASPVGNDPAKDGTRQRVKDAAQEARAAEKRGIEAIDEQGKSIPNPRVALPLWEKTRKLALTALETSCKDLEIAGYLMEAMVRTDGPKGQAESYRWTRLLVENFWDQLYPVPDPEDIANPTPVDFARTRIQPLGRLSGTESDGLLVGALKWVEITDASPGPYTFSHYHQVLELEKCNDKEKAIRIDRGAVSKANFDESSGGTSPAYFQALLNDLLAAQTEYKALITAVTAKCALVNTERALSPSSSRLQEALELRLSELRYITKGRLPEAASTPHVPTGDAAQAASAPAAPAIDNAMKTREDGFRALEKVADFFAQIEPQSLIPSQLRKIVRLGRLSPTEFLSEIIEDEKVRKEIFKVHGLETKPKNTEK